MVAEIVTRAVQSLASGACTIQFKDLIQLEFSALSINFQTNLTDNDIRKMQKEYSDLVRRWKEYGIIELELDLINQ
jgi:hypothetical protein